MKTETIFFSSRLYSCSKYKKAAERLFAKLDEYEIEYELVENTSDIWMRDYMPISIDRGKTKYVSFRYDPWYLDSYPKQKTNFKDDISSRIETPILIYSSINLDGGNVVFSPSKERVIISDRIYIENKCKTDNEKTELVKELEELLEAEVIIIPAFQKKADMTGHSDGMVRFIDEKIVFGNDIDGKHERKIESILISHGIKVVGFPYFEAKHKGSAVGCYINFLETEKYIFLPEFFGIDYEDDDTKRMDDKALKQAQGRFENRPEKSKKVVQVNINEIAKEGGVLNCISWEQ